MRTLLIEDEPKIAKALKQGLEGESFNVTVAPNGEEGFFLANAQPYDVILLDLMLPGRDGLEVLDTLRRRGVRTPVMILTARDAVEDRVAGLERGADDYLVKPFAFPELVARMKALLRRGKDTTSNRLTLADLSVDLLTRRVERGGTGLDLTTREFDLLVYLLRHKNELVSREMLAKDIWKETSRATPLDNVIDVHVSRLRKKLDANFAKKLLQTVRGVGFALREDAA